MQISELRFYKKKTKQSNTLLSVSEYRVPKNCKKQVQPLTHRSAWRVDHQDYMRDGVLVCIIQMIYYSKADATV